VPTCHVCNLRFTASQYALLSALASIAGRLLTGTTVGGLIDVDGLRELLPAYYAGALPGVFLFWFRSAPGCRPLDRLGGRDSG